MKAASWAWFAAGGVATLAVAVGALPHTSPKSPAAKNLSRHLSDRHFVAPLDLTATGIAANRPFRPFTTVTHDGRPVHSTELLHGQPLVLIFIKQGCPCSVEFEPFFHRLEQAYRGWVRFVGVLDGPEDAARRYVEANHVPYPVLADADLQLIRQFQVANGAYVALITADGRLDTLSPGCSVEMMRALGRRLAGLAGVEETPLEFDGMPHALTTGCPFET